MDQIKSLFPSEIPLGKPPSSAWLSALFLFPNHCSLCQVDIEPSQFTISHGLVSSGYFMPSFKLRKLCYSHRTVVRGGNDEEDITAQGTLLTKETVRLEKLLPGPFPLTSSMTPI